DTLTTAGRTVRPRVPCFADPRGHVTFGTTTATIYTANQGIDTWHVLYAWRRGGSLYTLSQHVAPPFTYAKVVQNLNRMLRVLGQAFGDGAAVVGVRGASVQGKRQPAVHHRVRLSAPGSQQGPDDGDGTCSCLHPRAAGLEGREVLDRLPVV